MKRSKPNVSPCAELSDRALLLAMRQGERAALEEFFLRFQPLLRRMATVLGVQPALRSEVVVQCLDDAAIALSKRDASDPRSLAAYLVTALRHDVMNARRNEVRREARALRVRERSAASEWVVSASCSESSIRASNGPGADGALPLHPALERLAVALDQGLTADESQLLAWIGDLVPQREIATWLGISYGAVRARVVRLRNRLREAARRYHGPFSEDDRRVLDAFFRRTRSANGVTLLFGRPRASPPRDTSRIPLPGAGATRETDGADHSGGES